MPLKAVLVALGNILRRDDGAAHRVLELLGPAPEVEVFDLIQLTPEIAMDMAAAELVVFIDADMDAVESHLTAVGPVPERPSPLAHSLPPEEVVELSRRLFGFEGKAWLCRVPARDFSEGEGLTPECEAGACRAADLLRSLTGGAGL